MTHHWTRAAMRVAALALLLAAPGCDPGPPESTTDGAPSQPDAAEPEPDAAPDTGADARTDADTGPANPPWPEPLPAPMPGLSAVHDGRLLAAGETLHIDGPPAGLDHPVIIELVLVWRGAEPIAWPDPPAAWLEAPGFAWRPPPPAGLDPDGTAALSITFDPQVASTAGRHAARLAAPGTDFAVDVQVELRRPLRMVVIGGDGRTLVSDAYGADLRPAGEAMPPTVRHRITWGAGRFFRSWATGGEWQDPGAYAYSDDGLEWSPSTAAPEFWAAGCAYRVDRFACAVGDRFAWSMTGAGVVHEATRWQGMLHAMAFAGDRFVAVGRGGRRAVSFDGATWAHDSDGAGLPDGIDDDWFFAVTARPEGDWVAVGGRDSTLTAHSLDGIEWTVAREPGTRGSTSVACLPGLCLRDAIGAQSPLYASADGITWRPVEGVDRQNLFLLGAVNGGFVAAANPWQQPGAIVRSRDGVVWDELYVSDDQTQWVALAIEGWEPDR